MKNDDLLGSGRTTRQLRKVLPNGVFIVDHNYTEYTKDLARSINRPDIQVKSLSWLCGESWQGMEFTDVELDHAVELTPRVSHCWIRIQPQVRRPK